MVQSKMAHGDPAAPTVGSTHDGYPLVNIQDFSNHVAGCTTCSTIDLVNGCPHCKSVLAQSQI
jgi:hypothetical protein